MRERQRKEEALHLSVRNVRIAPSFRVAFHVLSRDKIAHTSFLTSSIFDENDAIVFAELGFCSTCIRRSSIVHRVALVPTERASG